MSELLIATPYDGPKRQIDAIADWLAGDCGVPKEAMEEELTALFYEWRERILMFPKLEVKDYAAPERKTTQ